MRNCESPLTKRRGWEQTAFTSGTQTKETFSKGRNAKERGVGLRRFGWGGEVRISQQQSSREKRGGD